MDTASIRLSVSVAAMMKVPKGCVLYVTLVTFASLMVNILWLNLNFTASMNSRRPSKQRWTEDDRGSVRLSENAARALEPRSTRLPYETKTTDQEISKPEARINKDHTNGEIMSTAFRDGEQEAIIAATSKSKNTVKQTKPVTLQSTKKYILPVMLGNQGPNNQLQALKSTIAYAMHRNRTLVTSPFYNHFTLGLSDFRPFNDTLDTALLGKLLPVATMEEFKSQCPRGVEVVLHAINHTWSMSEREYKGTFSSLNRDINTRYSNATGISFPDFNSGNSTTIIGLPVEDIPIKNMPLKKFLEMSKRKFESKSRCVAMVYAYGMWKRFWYGEYLETFARHVRRAPPIRRMAATFVQKILGGAPYIAVHWRFNAEYKSFWCDLLHYNVCIMFNVSHSNVSNVFLSYMKQLNVTSLYFASTLSVQNPVLQHLYSTIPGFYTISDLISSSQPSFWKLKGDNYKTSLVEQEICRESTFFIASRLSSWSDTVVEERLWLNHSYMPDIIDPHYIMP